MMNKQKNRCLRVYSPLKQLYLYACLWIVAACAPARPTVSPLQPEALNSDAILFSYPGDSVAVREFLSVYHKNNADSIRLLSGEARAQALRDYLDLYVNFKLKVKAAEDAGMAQRTGFQQELEKYRQQLARPYMVENRVTEQLIQEAYDRLQQEVRASHLLLQLREDASPADTLAAYRKIDSLRTLALNGASFAMLAEQHSEDPSAASNGGDLGYFTALQMVYPFESAAYSTPPDSISTPVRTSFGYHIIKVQDKRPARGKIKVAHILIRPSGSDPEGKDAEAYKKATQIYEQLQKGADWKEMTERFSEDVSTRSSGGELPYFGTGNMMPAFEDAAFALENPGDISRPFMTRFGWHIIKLIDKQTLPSLSELRATLESKVESSVRSEVLLQDVVNRLKQENGFQPSEENTTAAIRALYTKAPEIPAPQMQAVLFTIRDQAATAGDFYSYVRQQQNSLQADSTTAHRLYQQFETRQIMKDEEKHLADKYEDYRRLLREYRDGILLFDIMEQQVWSKASEDSAGLHNFFMANRERYRWKERVKATLIDVQQEATLRQVRKALSEMKMPLTEQQIDSLENKYNVQSPLTLQIHQGTYERGGYRTAAEKVIDQVAWKKGEQSLSYNDRMYLVIIHEILLPKLKDLSEIKGIVIADYQQYLDKQWIATLRQKYPVEVYENVLQQLISTYQAP